MPEVIWLSGGIVVPTRPVEGRVTTEPEEALVVDEAVPVPVPVPVPEEGEEAEVDEVEEAEATRVCLLARWMW